MSPPLLVVEVVSPGELQRNRDYIAKRMRLERRFAPSPSAKALRRSLCVVYGGNPQDHAASQYQDVGIPEYWIIDPNLHKILVLQLSENDYREAGSFSGESQLSSLHFPQLDLTPAQIFNN